MGVPLRPLTKGVTSVPRRHGSYRRLGEIPQQVVGRQEHKASLEHREETKKMSLVAAQVGPAIGFALQVLAQAKLREDRHA